jgi:hypothetical protein
MEWTCSRCGIAAKAADWRLLATIGWRKAHDSHAPVCVVCVKQQGPSLERPRAATIDPQPALGTRPRGAPLT